MCGICKRKEGNFILFHILIIQESDTIQISLKILYCLPFFFYGSHTAHKLWTEICEIKQIFKGDFKILSDFYKNHFGAPQKQKAFI